MRVKRESTKREEEGGGRLKRGRRRIEKKEKDWVRGTRVE